MNHSPSEISSALLRTALLLLLGVFVFTLPSCNHLSNAQPIPVSTNPVETDSAAVPTGSSTASPITNPILEPFSTVTAIWANGEPVSQDHQIVLCRHQFTVKNHAIAPEFQIFADTRYEVWIDGQWIGRGPARFSKTLREYDQYPLEDITAGEYLVAVLVQWAPNIRRSESTTPLLMARLLDHSAAGSKMITSTYESWRCTYSDAWRLDAAPVHTSGLIGPTELLDFRKLPPDWNQPGFLDHEWPLATRVEPGSGVISRYQPRSIPLMVNKLIPSTAISYGAISPGFAIGETPLDLDSPYIMEVTATVPTSVTLEVLVTHHESITETELLAVDHADLRWQPAGPSRPDVYFLSINIDPGPHRISFNAPSPQGVTFGISENNLVIPSIPFEQGVHAGRRTLLAQLSSDIQHVQMAETDGGWQVTFEKPPAYAILDLGRTVHGRITAEAIGSPGSIIDVGWDERIHDVAQRPLPYPGSLYPDWNQVDSWVMDGTARLLTTIDARSGRYLLITAWGENPISLRNIQVKEEHYPVIQTGSFDSSDPLLNQIWQVGVESLIPNMLDAYVDTSWRERGQWWGDAYVANRINQVAFGDNLLINRGIHFMADSMMEQPSPGLAPNNRGHHMLDFTMLWVHSLAETIQNSPSDQGRYLADQSYAALKGFMEHLKTFENPNSGLLDLPKGHWSHNAYIDGYAWQSRPGQSTALNSLYYSTIQQAAAIAELVNDPAYALELRDKGEQLKKRLNETLFIPSEHRYLSSISGDERIEPSPQAQAWPLVYGLVPEEQISQVADSLLELISTDPAAPNINVYGMYWALEALGRAGKIDEGIEIVRRYYRYMLDHGAKTWWEVFGIYPNPQQSLSHAWGGAPTRFLTTYVLGASQTGPYSWHITPAFDSLTTAAGTLPLSDGSLWVQWHHQTCSEIILEVSSDSRSAGRVDIAYDPSISIRLNHVLVWYNDSSLSDIVKRNQDLITLGLRGGDHAIAVERNCKTP